MVPPAALEASIKVADQKKAAELQQVTPEVTSSLASYIRGRYYIFRNHRNNNVAGWATRLLAALQAFKGVYPVEKLIEIRKFGGSEVYARVIASKSRGATSLLRDVYLTPDKPWGIDPAPDPEIPADILQKIQQLVSAEMATLEQAGQPAPDIGTIRDRVTQLVEAARDQAKRQAEDRAKVSEDKIEELLEDGGFYKALAEFLVDLPLFPFACIKGPTVKIVQSVSWSEGGTNLEQKPRLTWQRVSPFDILFTPGVNDIEDAEIIERFRLTRTDLNDLLDLPGYNVDEVRAVLDEYGRGGLYDDWDSTDSERAVQENRENPMVNQSGMINGLEFHGNVQGRLLREYGMTPKQIPDELRDYAVQVWMIGNHVIKVQFSPSPRKRHPYFITSFEKVPGTPLGNGLPDILADVADVCNASLRALVNNLSISSGPQVMLNDDLLADNEDGENLFPWKRWHFKSDPMGSNSQVPVSFFMPESNSNELLLVYKSFSDLADELSAIPKYETGTGAPGGAGRTASGLAMLMTNASKLLQTVAANVDRDVLTPSLQQLYDMIMLTDTSGILQGDESIRIMGVNVAIQRETQRSRQLEFLQITNNPVDAQIVGPKGRAAILRNVAQTIGMPGEDIVPSGDQLAAMQQAHVQQQKQQPPQMAPAAANAQGAQPTPAATNDMGPRTNIAGGVG